GMKTESVMRGALFPFELLFELLDLLQIVGVGLDCLSSTTVLVKSIVAGADDTFHVIVADRTGPLKHRSIIKFQHSVHVVPPEIKRQILPLLHAQIRLFQKDNDQAVERVDLVLRQVILRDNDVMLADTRAGKTG